MARCELPGGVGLGVGDGFFVESRAAAEMGNWVGVPGSEPVWGAGPREVRGCPG